MSIHYLIDPFTTNGDIIDVTTALNGQTNSTGSIIIRIPDGVAVHNNPVTLPTLLTEKYDGLLASYAGFQNIFADSLLDATGINTAHVLTKGLSVSDGFTGVCLQPGGSSAMFTVNHVGAITPAPTQCVFVYEVFQYVDSDDKTNRLQREYVEVAPNPATNILAAVSFNGGATFNGVADGIVLNIPVPDQGTDLVVAMQNMSLTDKFYLGGYALVY